MINSNRARSFLKLPLVLAMGAAGLAAQQACAHGYIESPQSRAFMCKSGINPAANCGAATNEPQSIEYLPNSGRADFPNAAQACHGEFTKCGPANGTIAAGGLSSFSPLNQQTANLWKKTKIKPGVQTFDWRYTAIHATRNFQFYITKKDWNPNQPLTRDSFDAKPLLSQDWGNAMPAPQGGKSSHTLNIPADRSGYHVVLATWMVGDNRNTFYQVVDVDIDNSAVAPSSWQNIGAVQPEPLKIGDKVKTRVFSAQGEQSAKQVVLDITTAEMGKENVWPKLLADKVNAAKLGYVMGELNDNDEVVADYGKNSIFVKKGSDISSVLVEKEVAGKPGELSITGIQSEYTIKDGKVDLHFNAIAKNGEFTVSAKVINANNETVAFQEANAGDNMPHFSLPLINVSAGKYDLVVVAKSKKGEVLQKTASFTLNKEANGGGEEGGENGGKYDHVFPQGLNTYKAGTVVMQPKTGKTYECKPFPYSGYCTQWNAGATGFEPGVGTSWTSAWILK